MSTERKRIHTALKLVARYGTIEGSHHKQWVLDQVARVLLDCPTVMKTGTDNLGKRYEYPTLGENAAYREWCGGDGSWEPGTAP